jgi:hypothetical protein
VRGALQAAATKVKDEHHQPGKFNTVHESLRPKTSSNGAAARVCNGLQQQWFDQFREHLIQNLSIDRDDFDTIRCCNARTHPDGETMSSRKVLHDLVDKLPESELFTAARLLRALEAPADPFEALLASAPEDDESFDERELDDTDPPYLAHADVVRDRQDD